MTVRQAQATQIGPIVNGVKRCQQALPLTNSERVLLHEPAVTDYVGSHNGGELALHSIAI